MNDIRHTVTEASPAVPQDVAAMNCARTTLARFEANSPVFTESLRGPQREIVLGCMAMCFVAGIQDGILRLRNAVRADVLTDDRAVHA